jgi:hypothetical protein
MDDIDKASADYSKVFDAASDEEKKKLRDLRAEALDEDRTEIYSVNPAQSYVPAEFAKADPFWKPKSAAATKPAAKPAADATKPKQ